MLYGCLFQQLSLGINNFDYQIFLGQDGSVVGIEDLESGNPIILYPNPVIKSDLFIKGINGESRINIYDSMGKHIINKNTDSPNLSVSNLSKGVYIYIIESNDKIVTGKLVIK